MRLKLSLLGQNIILLCLCVSIREEKVILCTLNDYLEWKSDEKIMPHKIHLLMRFEAVREFQNQARRNTSGMESCKMIVKGIHSKNSVTSYYPI